MDNANVPKRPRTLLIGSVPLPDTETTFRKCHEWLPGRLDEVPDGETGERFNFVVYQRNIWNDFPHILTSFTEHDVLRMPRADRDLYDDKLQEMLERERPLDVMYDTYAIESYQTFKRLREEKDLDPGVRFQVSLPTPTNGIGPLIMPEYRMQVEPFYTESLISALRNIQRSIPADDLTIQIDVAFDIALLEEVADVWWDLKQTPLFEGVMARALILPRLVHPDIKLGFHLCYGDLGHVHFKQPKDLGMVIKVATTLLEECGREVDYVHVPVPIDRDDEAYFAPLADFEEAVNASGHNTMLYLGLVHPHDPDGTTRRINTASQVFKRPFGIATECGLGRTAPEDLDSIFGIIRSHTAPAS